MTNELIFIIHSSLLSLFVLIALSLGKEALVALICLYGVLANLFVTKQIAFFGFDATASDAFTVAAILGLNMIQEFFGAAASKRAIWINFLCLGVYTVASQLHLWYTPHILDYTHGHFCALLEVMPRIALASISVFLFVQYIDRTLYGFMQRKFGSRYFLMRNTIALILCQLLDTILFSFLGLWGIVEHIWHIIIISYAVKLLAISITSPWLMLVNRFYTHRINKQ